MKGSAENAVSPYIRIALPDDASRIYAVISQAVILYCLNSGIDKTQLSAGVEGPSDIENLVRNSAFFVYEKKGDIRGTIRLTFSCASDLLLEKERVSLGLPGQLPVCYISRFYVHPTHQAKGIGRDLLQFALAETRKKEIPYMFLHTALTNKRLVSFYNRYYFSLISEAEESSYPRGLFAKKIN